MTGRKEEVAQERRRRNAGTLDRMQQMKLTVPQEVRERYPEDEFRWVNDVGNRINDLTQADDWSKVDGLEKIHVGTDKVGQPIHAYLCRKRREYLAEDRKAMVGATIEQERGLLRGQVQPAPGAAPDQSPLSAGDSYVPAGNAISTAFTP